jgi:hypothetical protein
MTLGAHILPPVQSRNMICEVKGREKPDEVLYHFIDISYS